MGLTEGQCDYFMPPKAPLGGIKTVFSLNSKFKSPIDPHFPMLRVQNTELLTEGPHLYHTPNYCYQI